LAADIERWLADERPIAHAEPWTDTAFRWMRKNRLPVAVATALLLATSVALSVGYVLVSKQRDIAEKARRDALAANDRAQENAAATRKVIEEYLIRVGDDRWSNIPGFEGVRIDMANLAVERYRDLLKQQPNDESLVADRAMALRRSANLYRMVGQNEAAEKLYDESVGELKKVATGAKPASKYEQWLCETLCDRALLVARVSGPKAAIKPMREALDAGRRLETRQPTSVAARQAAARVEGDLADLLRQVGQFDEAVRLARSAARTLQEAADDNSRPLANRLTAALSGVNLGQTLHEAGLPADAEKVLHQTLERTSAYAKQGPTDANLRYIQARCQHELALVHVRAKELDKAGEKFREALASLAKLAEEFPKVISFRRKLAEALTDNARLDFSRGEHQMAVEGVRRSMELLEQLDPQQELPAMQTHLASACLLAGEIDLQRNDTALARTSAGRGREALEKARKFNPDSPVLAEEAKRLEVLLTGLGC
jgi:tetratricopeptide (TPR) repeat protein